MRSDYVAGGIVLSILGLVILLASGGLTFWATGTANGEGGTAAATIGIPPVIGWAMLLIGVIVLIVGFLDREHVHETYGSSRRARDKDITVIK